VDGTLIDTAETGASESGDRVGHLFAFDAASGKLRWKNTYFSNQNIDAISANGLLYVTTHQAEEPTHEWTAYRASDGQQVLQVSGGYSGRFLVLDGVIYAEATSEAATSTPQLSVFDTQVVALDAHTGQQLWQVTADSSDRNILNALLGVHNNAVYVQTGPSPFTATDAGHWKLEGVDSQSGHVRWSTPLQWLLGPVVVTDAAVYGYSTDLPGHLLALDSADGHTLWRTPIDSGQNGGEGGHRSLVLGNGTLYAAIDSGTLIALRAQDGAVLWTAQIEGSGTATIEGSVVGMTVVG
jgi:outer membrane protein assembly factor BamB